MRFAFDRVPAQDLSVGDVPFQDLGGNFDWYSDSPDGPRLDYKQVVSVTRNDDEMDGGYVLPAYDVVVSAFTNGDEVDPGARETTHLRAFAPVTVIQGHFSSLWD